MPLAAATSTDPGAVVLGLVIWALIFIAYWIPTVIALARRHTNKWAILAVNGLLGWTFFGWVGALVWSLWRTAPRQVTYLPPVAAGYPQQQPYGQPQPGQQPGR